MNISGIQRMTLLDFPGRVACTLFTGGCNMRCPFCHNAMLVVDHERNRPYDIGEIFEFLSKRKGILDGVAITGGEPTLQGDLFELIRDIKKLGFDVKLDTNGTRPAVLQKLIENSLVDYVAMDIKNSGEKYGKTVGIDGFDMAAVEESAALLMRYGRDEGFDFEFRTTVVRQLHTHDDMKKIGQWLAGDEKFFLQQFVDSGNLIDNSMTAWDNNTLSEFKNIMINYIPNTSVRGI